MIPSGFRWMRLAPYLMLLAVALPAASVQPAQESASGAARRILSDPRYQGSLPGAPRSVEAETASSPRPPARPPLRIPLPELGSPGALVRLVGYGLLALGAVLLVVLVLRALLPRLAAAEPAPAGGAEDEGELAGGDAPTLEGAQLLARQGRYVEALHHLLLAAIHRLGERRKQAPPAHLTSRELARALPLSPDSRQAFGELVAGVEASLFGGGAVGEEDFARGLERYRSLVERRSPGG